MAAADFKGALPPGEAWGRKGIASNGRMMQTTDGGVTGSSLMAAFAVAARAQGPVTLEVLDPTGIAEVSALEDISV